MLSLRAECSKNGLCGVALLRLRAVFLRFHSRVGLLALATDITRTASSRVSCRDDLLEECARRDLQGVLPAAKDPRRGGAPETDGIPLDPQHRPLAQADDRRPVLLVELADPFCARLSYVRGGRVRIEVVHVDLERNEPQGASARKSRISASTWSR
jgi:hypothetical protein